MQAPTHIYGHTAMSFTKTTIEINEDKLERVMLLGNFNTRKEAVDWALTEAVRLATLNNIENNPWSPVLMERAVHEDYDPIFLRQHPVDYRDVSRAARAKRRAEKKAVASL
jgi:nicotinamide mononucleotide adenylyltransferase